MTRQVVGELQTLKKACQNAEKDRVRPLLLLSMTG